MFIDLERSHFVAAKQPLCVLCDFLCALCVKLLCIFLCVKTLPAFAPLSGTSRTGLFANHQQCVRDIEPQPASPYFCHP